MKPTGRLPLLLLAATSALLAGCESIHSMRDSVKERIVGAPPHVRVVNGDEKQVFAAAKLAMNKLGYDFVRGGPAQGLLEGLSRIDSGATFRSSRQRSITINLQPGSEGMVEVQVWIKEIEESDFDRASNPATEVPLRDPAAFDVFFETLQQEMQGAGAK
ncbi:MAG TPA: hypothetical protein VMD31_03180 [Opitutaceae bacterium]|nr:hypothetical protein [Opitutaceae bacterium]